MLASACHHSPRSSPRPYTHPITRAAPRSSTVSPRLAHIQSSPLAGTRPSNPPSTSDAGTQYSPPDWPPTDPRSSLSAHNQKSRGVVSDDRKRASIPPIQSAPRAGSQAAVNIVDNSRDASREPSEQSEPQARLTPHSSLHNGWRKQRPSNDDAEADSKSPSASKRARHILGSHNYKLMPANYVDCEPKILASIIAEMLLRLIQHNDSIPLKDGQLTRFHSRAPPGISVHDYLARLTFHATLVNPILLSMVFFIDRLSGNFPTFIINSLTVHRFLITAATVASKGLSDSFWTNQTYARVGGVSVKELALLELELLMKCDWKIIPRPDQLVEYYRGLVEQSEDWVLEGSEATEEEERGRSIVRALPNAVCLKEDATADEMDTSSSNDS